MDLGRVLAVGGWALLGMGLALASAPAAEVRPLGDVIAVPAADPCLGSGLSEPVATWLGRGEVAGDLEVDVTVDGDSVGFRLLRGGEVRVERSLSPAPTDCADRRAALGLAIAMALDAAVLESLAPPPQQPKPVPPAVDLEPAPEPSTRADSAPQPPPARTFRSAVTADAATLLGVLPRVGLGGELGLELGGLPWLDVRVSGGFVAGLSAPLSGGRLETRLGWAGAELCPARAFGRVRLRLCAGVVAGGIGARGRGFSDSRQVTLAWVAAKTGPDLGVWITDRVALRVGGRVLSSVVRTEFEVVDRDGESVALQQAAAAGGQVGVGVVVRLWGARWAEPAT